VGQNAVWRKTETPRSSLGRRYHRVQFLTRKERDTACPVATKEDILEQLVEEFLTHRGYFVRHNVKFLPSRDHPEYVQNQDSNHSDINVLGYNPRLEGPDRVWAVSCKSWQGGFRPASKIVEIEENKKRSGREVWKGFRELASPKWSEGFIAAIQEATGATKLHLRYGRNKTGGRCALMGNSSAVL